MKEGRRSIAKHSEQRAYYLMETYDLFSNSRDIFFFLRLANTYIVTKNQISTVEQGAKACRQLYSCKRQILFRTQIILLNFQSLELLKYSLCITILCLWVEPCTCRFKINNFASEILPIQTYNALFTIKLSTIQFECFLVFANDQHFTRPSQ